ILAPNLKTPLYFSYVLRNNRPSIGERAVVQPVVVANAEGKTVPVADHGVDRPDPHEVVEVDNLADLGVEGAICIAGEVLGEFSERLEIDTLRAFVLAELPRETVLRVKLLARARRYFGWDGVAPIGPLVDFAGRAVEVSLHETA